RLGRMFVLAERQGDGEGRPFADLAFALDTAVVPRHHRVDNRQAQADTVDPHPAIAAAAAGGLGSSETLEEHLQLFPAHPGGLVGDGEGDSWTAEKRGLGEGADDLLAWRAELYGVVDQVDQGSGQQPAVASHHELPARIANHDLD